MNAEAVTQTIPVIKLRRLECKLNLLRLSRRAGVHRFSLESMEQYGSPALPDEQEALSHFFERPKDELFQPDGTPTYTVVTLDNGRPTTREDER